MKYTIQMGCGHEDTVELFGKDADRQKKIEYFKEKGLCKSCYRKKMEELTANSPFVFNMTVLPYIDEDNGNVLLNVWFEGNTMPYKDKIKSLGGYRWCEREAAEDFFSMKRPPLCWNKIIALEKLQEEIEKAKSIGAECISVEEGLLATVNYTVAMRKHQEWMNKNAKIKELAKPKVPGIIKGKRWNQTIYGKSDNLSIYVDGEKIMISDDLAEELKEYVKQKEEYKKQVEEIKNGGEDK